RLRAAAREGDAIACARRSTRWQKQRVAVRRGGTSISRRAFLSHAHAETSRAHRANAGGATQRPSGTAVAHAAAPHGIACRNGAATGAVGLVTSFPHTGDRRASRRNRGGMLVGATGFEPVTSTV